MEKDIYRGSRIGYIIEEAANYFITILLSGAYLAKLTQELGFSDSLTAILSAFITVGCSFQMLALVFFRKGRVKRKVTAFYTINEILFALLYFVPVFGISKELKTFLFIVFLLFGYMLLNSASAPRANWFMSLIPDRTRGKFTAVKEAISLVGGIAFQFIISDVIDKYEASGDMRTAFIICGTTIFLLTVIHTLSLLLSKEKEPAPKKEQSFKKDFIDVFKDKRARSAIIISSLWGVCNSISVPFYGTYMIKELGFSMFFVAVMSFVYAVSRILASIFLGAYADRTSFAKMMRVGYILVATGFLIATFMTPSNGHITYTIYYTLYAAAMGGLNSAELNIIYDCVAPEKRANALCIKQTIYGLSAFVTTLAASSLLSYIQNSGNRFLGISIYAQQVLSAIALLLTTFLIFYLSSHMKKIGKKGNKNEQQIQS